MIRSVVYLQRNGILFSEKGLPSVVTFPFHKEQVRDLDVIDKPALIEALTRWIDANKILPSTVLLVLSDSVLFTKEFTYFQSEDIKAAEAAVLTTSSGAAAVSPLTPATKVEREKDINSYKDSVPFDEVAFTTMHTGTSERVIATNRELLDAIRSAFISRNSTIDVAAAAFTILDKPLTSFTQETEAFFLSKYDILKQHNLLVAPQIVKPATLKMGSESKQSHKREIILACIFALLLIPLGIMVYTTFLIPKPKRNIVVPHTEQNSGAMPTSTIELPVSSVSAVPAIPASSSAPLITIPVTPTKVSTQSAKL